MKNTKNENIIDVTLTPLREDDREQFIIDNHWGGHDMKYLVL